MTSKIKLIISNPDVLHRLIGGDTELELELRQCAAAEFAKRHLKSIINDDKFIKLKDDIKNDFNNSLKKEKEEILKDIGKYKRSNSYFAEFVLDNKIKEKIKSSINVQTQNYINSLIKEEMKTKEFKEKIQTTVELYLNQAIVEVKNTLAEKAAKLISEVSDLKEILK